MALALAAVVMLAPALFAGPSSAAVPSVLGDGSLPNVAIGPDRTAHVVWNREIEPTIESVRYCQVPPGAQACTKLVDLTTLDDSFGDGRPYVFLKDGGRRVLVFSGRCCYFEDSHVPSLDFPGTDHTVMWESTDGGVTWPVYPRSIGTVLPNMDAVLGPPAPAPLAPDWSFQAVGESGPVGLFQLMPFSPNPDQGEQEAEISPDHYLYGSVGLSRPNASNAHEARPVATFDDGDHTVFVRYIGFDRAGPLGALNLEVNWKPPAFAVMGSEGRLASGPAGLYLLVKRVVNKHGLFLLRYRTTKFGKARRVTPVGEGGELYEADFAQDPKGRLHAVWRRNRAGADQLRHSKRGRAGKPWTKPKTLALSQDIFALRVAAGNDGHGLVVWDENDATGRIWAVVM